MHLDPKDFPKEKESRIRKINELADEQLNC